MFDVGCKMWEVRRKYEVRSTKYIQNDVGCDLQRQLPGAFHFNGADTASFKLAQNYFLTQVILQTLLIISLLDSYFVLRISYLHPTSHIPHHTSFQLLIDFNRFIAICERNRLFIRICSQELYINFICSTD